jgi:lipoate-protein ligase B
VRWNPRLPCYSILAMSGSSDTTLYSPRPFEAYDLGLADYLATQDLQARLRRFVTAGEIPGVLLLLEHPPVITLGAHALAEDVLDPARATLLGVQVALSERGGQTTMHSPGQLVAYPIMPIPRRDLRTYVHNLEEVLLLALAHKGLEAQRVPGRPGLYLAGRKIASLGLRCEHGVSSHGSSLNVNIDLALYDLVTSCGDPCLKQTSMLEATGRNHDMMDMKETYLRAFRQVFAVDVAPLRSMPTAGFEPAAPGSGGQCSIP